MENSTATVVEKKSKFIANLIYVSDEEEAREKLSEIKKLHYEARHNCYAYVIGVDGKIQKSSDDGEPSGTAGHPMLDILNGNGLTNCIAIVTRYFGGILLGTGGLVRCYSDSLKACVENAKTSDIYNGYEVSFNVSYDDYGKIEKLVGDINQSGDSYNENAKMRIRTVKKEFLEDVKISYLVIDDTFETLKTKLTDITRGKVIITNENEKYYYMRGNKVEYIFL